MSRINSILTASVAALLLGGNAFAAGLQPAAGEAPFADQAAVGTSLVQRADVRAEAARQQPVAGELVAPTQARQDSRFTRPEVRQATRNAIEHGYRVPSGAMNARS